MKRANGDGAIIKLGGKRRNPYAVRVTVGWNEEGKQLLKYIGYYKNKTEAKKALNEYLVDPYDLNTNDITLIEVFEKWKATSDLAEKTMKNYVSAFNKAEPIHNLPIKDIKVHHLESVIENLSPHTKKVFKNAIGQIYTYAEKHEIVDKNPMNLISIKQAPIAEKKPLTSKDIKLLLSYEHELADTAKIMLYTGMRVTELLELENAKINLEERYLITGIKTEAGKNRIIPIHDTILPIMAKWYDPNNKYFLSYKNKKIAYRSYRSMYWDKMQKETGLEFTPHNLRHTFATFADRLNLNRIAVKRIMGHSLKDVTDVYTHKELSELLEEINKLKY